jgi:hypothetical protein
MSVWENIPVSIKDNLKKSFNRLERVQKRKSKIKKLCLLQEDGVKMVGNTDKKTI